MKAAGNHIKNLYSGKENENTNEWILKYIEKEKRKNEEIKKLISSYDYINWIIKFTIDKDSFSDKDYLYNNSQIRKDDLDNITKLSLFYKGIDKYATENYIYPTPCEFGNFYKVRLNKIGLKIGIIMNQETIFFCEIVQIDSKEYIDLNDIIHNKKQQRVDYINSCLNSISDMVLTSYMNGVPIKAIKNTLDDALKEITNKDEEKQKKLLLS